MFSVTVERQTKRQKGSKSGAARRIRGRTLGLPSRHFYPNGLDIDLKFGGVIPRFTCEGGKRTDFEYHSWIP